MPAPRWLARRLPGMGVVVHTGRIACTARP